MDELRGNIEQCYRRYFAMIRAKCRRVLGDTHEAEDVAQETFVRLWRDRRGIGPDPRSVSAWIYRTATRLAIDQLRSRRSRADSPVDEGIDHDNPERLLGVRRALGRVASQLSPEELEVAILSRIDGLGQQEIGEVLGRSERTVRRVLSRIEDRLGSLSEAP